MGKKSFTNPAAQFMPSAVRNESAIDDSAKAEQKEQPTQEQAAVAEPKPVKATPKKKPVETPEPAPQVAPGYENIMAALADIKPEKVERKTRRLNFVFQPSLVDAIKQASQMVDMSANDFCAQVIKRYLVEKGFLNHD